MPFPLSRYRRALRKSQRTRNGQYHRRILLEQLEVRRLLTNNIASVNSDGTANGIDPGGSASPSSSNPSISADGRFTVFQSFADDLDDRDDNAAEDIFVFDRELGTTALISVNAAGTASGTGPGLLRGASFNPAISDDGRFVVFASAAVDLTGDLGFDGTPNIFVRDRDPDGNGIYDEPGSAFTFLISIAEDGSAAGDSGGTVIGPSLIDRPVISGNGKTVAFVSGAPDIALSDPTIVDANGVFRDLYIASILGVDGGPVGLGDISVASLNFAGDATGFSPGGASAGNASISTAGAVAFQSDNIDMTDLEIFSQDVYLARPGGSPSLISINAKGTGGGNDISRDAVISRDGRHVAFISEATDLVGEPVGPATGIQQVYVRDLKTGVTTLISRNGLTGRPGNGPSPAPATVEKYVGGPSISDDGRYVVFNSLATDLLDPTDPKTFVPDENGARDIFVFDRDADEDGIFDETGPGETKMKLVSMNAAGTAAAGTTILGATSPVISGDGNFVAFASGSPDVIDEVLDGAGNVFLRDLRSDVTSLVSRGIAPPPTTVGGNSGSGFGQLGKTSIVIAQDDPILSYISVATNLDADTPDSNGSTAVDVINFAPSTDIILTSNTADGFTTLTEAITIENAPATAFEIGFFRSTDPVFDPATDILLDSVLVSDPADLAIGSRELDFTIGSGPGEVGLPGVAGVVDPLEDYFILAVADFADAVPEFDLDPFADDNVAILFGGYQPDGTIFAHGSQDDDTVSMFSLTEIDIVTGELVEVLVLSITGPGVPGGSFIASYLADDVMATSLRLHDGADIMSRMPLDDLVFGGPGDDVLSGGLGDDIIFGGDGFDALFDGPGDDLLDTGGPAPFGGTINGVPGSDNIYIGAGEDLLTFEDATLGITFDVDAQGFQVVDADQNRVNARGFSQFNLTRFQDTLSVDVKPDQPYFLDGGPESDTLIVDALNQPAKDTGVAVLVPGNAPVLYANFENVIVLNALPWIEARLIDQLENDVDQDRRPDPGDTLRYSAQISNDGTTDATNVILQDFLDLNLTLVPNSAIISPIALHDMYTAPRGVPLIVNQPGQRLLDNDFDPDRRPIQIVSPLEFQTLQGGKVLVTDPQTGAFEYLPPVSQVEQDQFVYRIEDTDGLGDTATATIDLFTRPVVPDNFNWFGNTLLDSSARNLPSLFANDAVCADNGGCTLIDFSATTSQGGSVNVNDDGSFVYNPPVGHTGPDTFSYTVGEIGGDEFTTDVTIDLNRLIWYVDDDAQPGGDGRSGSPLNDLNLLRDANGNNLDGPGDIIYLAEGNYDGPLQLAPSQELFGEGVDLIVDGTTLHEGDATKTPNLSLINNTEIVLPRLLTLSTDNFISGINFQTRNAHAIVGKGINTVNISHASVNTVNGQALNLDGRAINGGGEGEHVWPPSEGGNTSTIDFESIIVLIQQSELPPGFTNLAELQIAIDLRFVSLRESFLQQIGVDFDFNIQDSKAVVLDNAGGISIGGGSVDGTTSDAIYTKNANLKVENVSIGAARPVGGNGVLFHTTDDATTDDYALTLDNNIMRNVGQRGIYIDHRDNGNATARINENDVEAATAGIDAHANGIGNLALIVTENRLVADLNTFRAQVNNPDGLLGLNLGFPPPASEGNEAGVYVLSNLGGTFLLGGSLGVHTRFTDTDNGNVANNGNTVNGISPVLGQNLFVNGEMTIVNPQVISRVFDQPNVATSTVDKAIIAPDPHRFHIGTLPAGKSVTVQYLAQINNPLPFGVSEVRNQGLVIGDNFKDTLTDDPSTPEGPDATITKLDPNSVRGTTIFVNVGGPEIQNGVTWEQDTQLRPSPYLRNELRYFALVRSTDEQIDTSSSTIPPGTPAEIFQTGRKGLLQQMQYDFPVDPGQYVVRLYFAEQYDIRQPGDRVFDVNIEGETVLDDFDILATTGEPFTGYVHTSVVFSDENLDVDFLRQARFPLVSAISIQPLTITIANEEGITDGSPLSAFTNPVNRRDVDGDGYNSASDVLAGVADLNAYGSRLLPDYAMPGSLWVDTDGDGYSSAADVLASVAWLNAVATEQDPPLADDLILDNNDDQATEQALALALAASNLIPVAPGQQQTVDRLNTLAEQSEHQYLVMEPEDEATIPSFILPDSSSAQELTTAWDQAQEDLDDLLDAISQSVDEIWNQFTSQSS